MLPTNPLKILILAGVSLLGGCATVDFNYPKQPSYAVAPSINTELGRETSVFELAHPGESGFEMQMDGIRSLAARLALAEDAQLSIDAQYYLIKDDLIGFLFVGVLLEAADRGVRVRLLLDDIFTQGFDEGFMALDSHPNFEIRVFNPWASRNVRFGDLFSFKRLNRRMHTKSYTVDNEVTIVGGRNIADEYYGARQDVNFGDIDVMGIGPVVAEVSTMFDEFWNHRLAMPIAAVADTPDDPQASLQELRAIIADQVDKAREGQYASAVISDFEDYIASDDDEIFTWAPYVLAYDPPDKADSKNKDDIVTIVEPLAEAIEDADERLVVVSPYFVPRKGGIQFFEELRNRDIEVIVVTNSLAANNHTVVHSGYAPSRKPLLELGVELYEVKSTEGMESLQRAGTDSSRSTLHSKAFLVDDNQLFVGSFNWDPRSINLNTEAGIIINSKELAAEFVERFTKGEGKHAYHVVLDDIGRVRWIDNSGDEEVVLNKEPDTSWWKRFKAGAGELLPIRSQL